MRADARGSKITASGADARLKGIGAGPIDPSERPAKEFRVLGERLDEAEALEKAQL